MNNNFLTENEITNLRIAINNPNLESQKKMNEFLSDIRSDMIEFLPDGIVINFDEEEFINETNNSKKNQYKISRMIGSSFYSNNFALAA